MDIIGAEYIREIENGEIVIIDKNGIESMKPFLKSMQDLVWVYLFARPDSILKGKAVHEYRKNLGNELAKESYVEADMISPIQTLVCQQHLDLQISLT